MKYETDQEREAVTVACYYCNEFVKTAFLLGLGNRPGLLKCVLRSVIMMIEHNEAGRPPDDECIKTFILEEFRQERFEE